MGKGSHSGQRWPNNPGDQGAHGESHTINKDGSGHHTLYRTDGTHISWNTDASGDYAGGGHTANPTGKPKNWS